MTNHLLTLTASLPIILNDGERKSPNELAKLSIVQLEISRTEAQGHAHGLHMGLNFDMGDEALNRFRMPVCL